MKIASRRRKIRRSSGKVVIGVATQRRRELSGSVAVNQHLTTHSNRLRAEREKHGSNVVTGCND